MLALVSFWQNFCLSCWHSPSATAVTETAKLAASEAARMIIAVFVMVPPVFPTISTIREEAWGRLGSVILNRRWNPSLDVRSAYREAAPAFRCKAPLSPPSRQSANRYL
jgi:hypothetical protein